MSGSWSSPDLFEASSDDEPLDRRGHEPHRNRVVVVGQGVLALDGGQPDFFDDDEEVFRPMPISTAPATIEPSRVDPLPLHELAKLARSLMDDHGLSDWRLTWDRAVRRAGQTRFRQKTISLSVPLMRLFPPSEARNTVLHEIAHALVGHAAGHGSTWKAQAAEIGARPERCFDSATARVDGDWSGVCSAGHSRGRHRAPKHFTVSCGVCLPGQFDERYLLRWYWRGIPVIEPGTDVEIVGDHEWTGLGGRIERLKDKRYLVILDDGRALNVPFTFVTVPGEDPASDPIA